MTPDGHMIAVVPCGVMCHHISPTLLHVAGVTARSLGANHPPAGLQVDQFDLYVYVHAHTYKVFISTHI